VTRLTGLDAQFADGNVMLGVLLGALGACTEVRALLPEPLDAADTRATPSTVDTFVALLLGAVALHERLTRLVDATSTTTVGSDESAALSQLTGLAR
jgi:hypothetical protein